MNINKLNIWFDELVEPIRVVIFLVAFVSVLGFSVLVTNEVWVGLVVWLLIAVCYRLPYLKNNLK